MLKDGDTLPPNLRELSVVDATRRSRCCRSHPAAELDHLARTATCLQQSFERLSALTQLTAVRLGYCVWRGGGWERAAQEGSAGWGAVPALKELELHRMWVDPASDLLSHLAGLTGLTRVCCRDETFVPQTCMRVK